MILIPKPGLRVRDPQMGDALPADGREVVDSTYWRRRLRDGDVTQGKPKTVAKTTAAKE